MTRSIKMTLPKVFVVDDVLLHLTSIKNRLKESFEIYPMQNAEIFFNTIKFIIPDLVLLDINMPREDGFAIIEKLKSSKKLSTIPVIFLSGNTDRESLEKAIQLGAVDYIFKPFTNKDIIDKITYHLNPVRDECDFPIILLVDDCPVFLNSLTHILSNQYSVHTLVNPEHIMQVLNQITPDIIILDYHMPGINGFELVPIIRKCPEHKLTPIIFLTNETSFDKIFSAIELGAGDYIMKPAEDEYLKLKIEFHLKPMLIRRFINNKWNS